LWELIEWIDNNGGTLLSAAVQSGNDAMFEAILDYALESLGKHEVAEELDSRLDSLFEKCFKDLTRKDHLEDVDSGFKTLSFFFVRAGSTRPSAGDLKVLSSCHKSRDGLKNCCLRAVTFAANPFIPGLVLASRLAEAAKEANEGDQRTLNEIRTGVEDLLFEILERLPSTVAEFDEDVEGGCAGMLEPRINGGHRPPSLERPLDVMLSKPEQMKVFYNVPLVMDFLSRRFAWGLPNPADTEGVLRNSEDLHKLGAGLVLGYSEGDLLASGGRRPGFLARLSTRLQAAHDHLPNLVFFPGAQFVVAGVAARPNSYYQVPAMRMLLDFVAYAAMIAALGYLVLFHTTTGGVLGDDGISDGELAWREGSFAAIFISTGVFREGREMWKDIDKYFKDQWNVLDALALVCLLIGLVIRAVDWTSPWGPAFYALSAPLIVGRVLFFAQVLRFQGPMIKVIFGMTTTLLKFGFVMVVVMTGFAMAFHVLFRDLDSFGTTFLGLFRAMLGEVDFFETFAGGRYDSVATILLVVYLFVVTI
ncbi:unnamed protein product, partial [Ectocarpus sp. 12 AP-2014]